MDVNVKTGLDVFLEELAKQRFEALPIKQEVRSTAKGYNIACPYCGDSKKNPENYRGNIYLPTKTFKCYNDGCFTFATLREFISKWAIEYGIDITDLNIDYEPDINISAIHQKTVGIGPNKISNYLREEGLIDQLPHISFFIRRLSLLPITNEYVNGLVKDTIIERDLLSIPNIDKIVYMDPYMDKLYIFNIDLSCDKVLAFSIRLLRPDKVTKKKYDTFPFSRIIDKFNLSDDYDDIDLIDVFGNYFNIMNIDFKQEVKLVEGQFDSLFINNCIASTGIGKMDFIFKFLDMDYLRIIHDNDKAGRDIALENIKNGNYTFLWVKLINDLLVKYPYDNKKIYKIKDINNLFSYFKTKANIDIILFNRIINNYFSNNIFDIIYV